jgi:chlorite dismutase
MKYVGLFYKIDEEPMPEETPRSLNHFAMLRFTPAYWALDAAGRERVQNDLLPALQAAAPCVHFYQVFPAEPSADFLVWSALPAETHTAPARFFEQLAGGLTPLRSYLELTATLWGFTRPSQYTKTRSAQEMDPFTNQRRPYLVMYPFVKTTDWYLMSREVRQGMMNEHIRIGKQYPEIQQLLLYSFGLQDQEFVVVYETDDLVQFSDLVNELRSSEARRYTLRDTPLFTGMYRPPEKALSLWK